MSVIEIGTEKPAIVIEPVESPVPGEERQPAPEPVETPTKPEPVKEPVPA